MFRGKQEVLLKEYVSQAGQEQGSESSKQEVHTPTLESLVQSLQVRLERLSHQLQQITNECENLFTAYMISDIIAPC